MWVADFTYVSTWTGWAYVAFVFDAYSRAIVGWTTATTKTAALVSKALNMAVWRRDHYGHPIEPGLRYQGVGPATGNLVVCPTLASLRRQRRDSRSQAGIAVAVNPATGTCPRGVETGRPTPIGQAGIDLLGETRIDLHQRKVVVGAGVRVGFAQVLHRQPAAVGQLPDPDGGTGGAWRTVASEGHRSTEREAAGLASVSPVGSAGARTMRCLSEIHTVGVVDEDIVRRALSTTLGEGLHAGCQGGRRRGRPTAPRPIGGDGLVGPGTVSLQRRCRCRRWVAGRHHRRAGLATTAGNRAHTGEDADDGEDCKYIARARHSDELRFSMR